ncbi:MAG: nitroreductase family protein [Anaerolineales bacterium]|nr:nitroreductase family protein [Anaerolineales bacterium]HUS85154.1 nitroreductase family protein [Anaerolineales bacterium]
MNVHDAIRIKRAIREFSAEPLPEDVMRAIVDAGRRAQSAKNRQPWHFIVIRDRETLKKLAELGTYAGHLAGAALGIAIVTPDPNQRWSILFDAGQAAAYMQLAAWELGVGSCPATIYQPEAARALLGYPQDLHLHVSLSFGYPAHPEQMTEIPKAGGRKNYAKIAHLDRWTDDIDGSNER